MQLKIKKKADDGKVVSVSYPLCWGTETLDRYCEAMGMPDDLAALDFIVPPDNSVPTLKIIKSRTSMIFIALQVGSELEGKEFDLTRTELQNHLDNISQEEYDAILQDWLKSKYMGRAVEEYLFVSSPDPAEGKEEAPKKKSRSAR